MTRRTKAAVALAAGSLPGVAELLAAGEVASAHVAVLVDALDDLPADLVPALDGAPVCHLHHKQLTDDGHRITRRNGTTSTTPTAHSFTNATNHWRK